MKNLSFWAQSLDNQDPDVIFKDGQELSDDKSRQKLVSEIYEIPKSNIEVLTADPAVTFRYSYPKFVIEAIPTQQDTIKRLAPIVIYGVFPDNFSEDGVEDERKDIEWVEDVRKDIEIFVSHRLNRTLDDRALVAIKDRLSEILKKKTEESRFSLLSVIKTFLYRLRKWLSFLVDQLLRR